MKKFLIILFAASILTLGFTVENVEAGSKIKKVGIIKKGLNLLTKGANAGVNGATAYVENNGDYRPAIVAGASAVSDRVSIVKGAADLGQAMNKKGIKLNQILKK